MMPEWHQLDSSSTMPEQQESTKKKTLKSSSRSFWFSTGLLLLCFISMKNLELVQKYLQTTGKANTNCFSLLDNYKNSLIGIDSP